MTETMRRTIDALHRLSHDDSITHAQAMEVSLFASRLQGWARPKLPTLVAQHVGTKPAAR